MMLEGLSLTVLLINYKQNKQVYLYVNIIVIAWGYCYIIIRRDLTLWSVVNQNNVVYMDQSIIQLRVGLDNHSQLLSYNNSSNTLRFINRPNNRA